jgi:hypothetical protein
VWPHPACPPVARGPAGSAPVGTGMAAATEPGAGACTAGAVRGRATRGFLTGCRMGTGPAPAGPARLPAPGTALRPDTWPGTGTPPSGVRRGCDGARGDMAGAARAAAVAGLPGRGRARQRRQRRGTGGVLPGPESPLCRMQASASSPTAATTRTSPTTGWKRRPVRARSGRAARVDLVHLDSSKAGTRQPPRARAIRRDRGTW